MTVYKFISALNLKTYFDSSSPLFSTRISLVAGVFIAVTGITLGLLEGSLAVQINGVIAAIDVINSILLLSAVGHSSRKPDSIFNYGYGKYESMSMLLSAVLMLCVAAYALLEMTRAFGGTGSDVGNYYALVSFSALSFLIMWRMSKFQRTHAKRLGMPILEFDADVWRSDSLIELGVLSNLIIGFVLIHFAFGDYARQIDSITALALTIYALRVPLKGSVAALNQLLDRTLSTNAQDKILSIVKDNSDKMCKFVAMHSRQSGKDIFIELDIVLPFDFSMKQKTDLERKLQTAIKKSYPTAITRIYALSCNGECNGGKKRNCPIYFNKNY